MLVSKKKTPGKEKRCVLLMRCESALVLGDLLALWKSEACRVEPSSNVITEEQTAQIRFTFYMIQEGTAGQRPHVVLKQLEMCHLSWLMTGIESIQQHCNVLYSCNTVWNLFLWPWRTFCQTVVFVCSFYMLCSCVGVLENLRWHQRSVRLQKHGHQTFELNTNHKKLFYDSDDEKGEQNFHLD